MPAADHPGTCLVLGVETQIGLGIVRELGRRGVRVVALTTDPQSLGAMSRHAGQVVTLAQPVRSEATLASIRALAESLGPCSLLAISESNLAWLAEHRAALGPNVFPALPPAEAFAAVTDKDRTLTVASALGIDVPRSEQAFTLDEWDALASRVRFPVVLKWAAGNDVGPLLDRHGLAFEKAEYVYDAEVLRAVGRRYQRLERFPLVQEYCAGVGFGQFFFMHHGVAVQRFQHRRIAEWPPEGGFSSVCDAVPLSEHHALQEQSIALLRAVGWEGVAMVEYRIDDAGGRCVLMEINGRFWGSFPLAAHAGAGFAWLAHRAALGLPFGEVPAPAARLRCRMVTTEVKRLVRILLQPERIRDRAFKVRPGAELWRFFADFLRPRVRYYVWDRDDPRPFLADLTGALTRRLR